MDLLSVLQLPEFILKNYEESKGITKADIWYIAEKRCAANHIDWETHIRGHAANHATMLVFLVQETPILS